MSRYTTTELSRTALDQITRSTPIDVLNSLQIAVEAVLDDQDFPDTAWMQIDDAFAVATERLDRIEQES